METSISIGDKIEIKKQVKYCLDNYSNIAKYIYKESVKHYNEDIFLENMYKILCVEPGYLDKFIAENKSKNEVIRRKVENQINRKGRTIKTGNMVVFQNIKSAATKHSKKINIFCGFERCVDVYKDWLKQPQGPGLAVKFVQMPARITLIIKEMIKNLNFSDSDNKELDGLHKKSICITNSIQDDTKITNIVEYVINTNKLNTNNLIKLKTEINKMYKIAKECQ